MLHLIALVEGSHRPRAVPRRAQIAVLTTLTALGAFATCSGAAVLLGLAPAEGAVVLNLPGGPAPVRPWSIVAATLLLTALSAWMSVECARARSTFVADTIALARTWPAGSSEIEARVELLLVYREVALLRTVDDLVPHTLTTREVQPAGLTFTMSGRPAPRPNPTVLAAFAAATLTLAATILTTAVVIAAVHDGPPSSPTSVLGSPG